MTSLHEEKPLQTPSMHLSLHLCGTYTRRPSPPRWCWWGVREAGGSQSLQALLFRGRVRIVLEILQAPRKSRTRIFMRGL